jgi:hypothetical protein
MMELRPSDADAELDAWGRTTHFVIFSERRQGQETRAEREPVR